MKNDLVISVSICLLVKKKKSIFQTFAQCLIWPPCIFRSAFRREESCSGRRPLGGRHSAAPAVLRTPPHSNSRKEAGRPEHINGDSRRASSLHPHRENTHVTWDDYQKKKKSDRPAEPGVMFLFPHHCMKNAPVNLKTTAPGMPPSKRLNATWQQLDSLAFLVKK